MGRNAQRQVLFVSACAGMLVFGIVLALLGTLFGMPETRERLHIDLAQQGNLFLLLYLGMFVASLIVGPLIDSIGNKTNLAISAVLVAAAMLLFTIADSPALASIAAIVLGVGGGGLNTCTNALVSDLYDENRGPMLNLLGIFFGIGALIIPVAAASIEGHFTVSQLLVFCFLLSGICALLYLLIPFPSPSATQAFSWREAIGIARNAGVLILAVLLFFESGNEACIAGWTSTYANASGFAPRVATLVLAGYWAALMISRIVAARLLRSISKPRLILTCGLLSIVGCVVLLMAASLVWLVVGVILIGLSYSPIFPTTLAIAGDRYPNVAGTVFGFLFSVALIGGMTFPWGVGQISQHLGIKTGMGVPFLGAIGICILSALMVAQEKSASAAKCGGAGM